ncbi:2-phospho-L-lactate transferase [Bradyrhizobium vignae]|uniref:2-phospho-L-lactate transferase n=1 Tax=Bradyrhizobium vignae TaxID=1549949 RepID=UPI0013E8A5DC|nr:2-phospho-L-lactate transferase [Bradyrhizobium vignae]
MKVAVLAGGVGGARMALGFAEIVPPGDLSIIVNVGDDDRFHGLYVCPDLDTVLYTLSGVVDRTQSWGVADDSTRALEVLRKLDSPGGWMKLGDADLGLHLYRTSRLAQGASLTAVTEEVSHRFGVHCALLPASDEECPTMVEAATGLLRFQEWFVRDRASPTVKQLGFQAARKARITDRVRASLLAADLVVLAPSNPYLSILPMLEIGGMRDALQQAPGLKVAVSPLIGGRAIKGPLVKLMSDLGAGSSNSDIAASYSDFADAFVVDEGDSRDVANVSHQGALRVAAMPTLIPDAPRAEELARRLLDFASTRRTTGAAG